MTSSGHSNWIFFIINHTPLQRFSMIAKHCRQSIQIPIHSISVIAGMGYSSWNNTWIRDRGRKERSAQTRRSQRDAASQQLSVDPLNPGGDASHCLVGWNNLIDSDGCCANWIRLVTLLGYSSWATLIGYQKKASGSPPSSVVEHAFASGIGVGG